MKDAPKENHIHVSGGQEIATSMCLEGFRIYLGEVILRALFQGASVIVPVCFASFNCVNSNKNSRLRGKNDGLH
jgi:hypothetical protein